MCVRNMHLSANVFEEMTKESGQLTKNELCLLINVFILASVLACHSGSHREIAQI